MPPAISQPGRLTKLVKNGKIELQQTLGTSKHDVECEGFFLPKKVLIILNRGIPETQTAPQESDLQNYIIFFGIHPQNSHHRRRRPKWHPESKRFQFAVRVFPPFG